MIRFARLHSRLVDNSSPHHFWTTTCGRQCQLLSTGGSGPSLWQKPERPMLPLGPSPGAGNDTCVGAVWLHHPPFLDWCSHAMFRWEDQLGLLCCSCAYNGKDRGVLQLKRWSLGYLNGINFSLFQFKFKRNRAGGKADITAHFTPFQILSLF